MPKIKKELSRHMTQECVLEGCKLADGYPQGTKLPNGKQVNTLLNGHWLWWCTTHNRPVCACVEEKLLKEIAMIKNLKRISEEHIKQEANKKLALFEIGVD